MQLNEIVDNLTEWVQENLCNGVELLKPSKNAMPTEYEMVTPTAFALYVPPKDQLPPDVDQQLPSICLQLIKGEDNLVDSERSLTFRLSFSCYRPGKFTEDEEGKMVFTRNAEGWKDLWLWISKSINTLQTKMYIEGVKLKKDSPIKYGHFTIDENLAEIYPIWCAWVEVTVTCGTSLKQNDYKEFL